MGSLVPALAAARLAGKGRHVVFVVGDQEYRSEESMPAFAKMLEAHHGFRCTLVLPRNPQTGEVDPGVSVNLVGLEALDKADLMVCSCASRNCPMPRRSTSSTTRKPAAHRRLRTSTHAFNYQMILASPYAATASAAGNSKAASDARCSAKPDQPLRGPPEESTRGNRSRHGRHPILRGVKTSGGRRTLRNHDSDRDSKPILLGQVLAAWSPQPLRIQQETRPVAWIKSYKARACFPPHGAPRRFR
jgi:hypothetical protein